MVEFGWYQAGMVQEATFVGQVSLVRAAFVSEKIVDAVKDATGAYKFLKYGILELDADLMSSQTGCTFEVTPDPPWQLNTHVIIRRQSGGEQLRAIHSEVSDLTDIANDPQRSRFIRLPRP
jgi:hypothetical protein